MIFLSLPAKEDEDSATGGDQATPGTRNLVQTGQSQTVNVGKRSSIKTSMVAATAKTAIVEATTVPVATQNLNATANLELKTSATSNRL